MHKQGSVGDFKYFVGISSLAQIATRDDRVCVLNILGGESSDVTPVEPRYSGGNVVFGTAPGKGGQCCDTAIGDIPVYNNVREGLDAGHRFNCGVVYLPPSAARDGVAELIRVNPELRKIFIVTEKIVGARCARDPRDGPATASTSSARNSLGVADSWNRGAHRRRARRRQSRATRCGKGSIAIFSNSGNFTTTIAHYLRMAGWGTTTLDLERQGRLHPLRRARVRLRARQRCAQQGGGAVRANRAATTKLDADFTKPVVACVVGRWKSKLTRAVGHAGAMAGGADDAAPRNAGSWRSSASTASSRRRTRCCSAKGAVVTNIAHIPAALTAVMRANAHEPDFAPEGSLALKPWFGCEQGIALPAEPRISGGRGARAL